MLSLVTSGSAITAAAAGLLFGGSLIIAIGAQNAFVLRQGLLREHRALVVATCAISDLVLIAAGVAGAGAVLASRPTLTTVVRFAGAAFLIAYGVLAARRALRPEAMETDDAPGAGRSAVAVLTTTLAFTWLNPHVYLDTLLLVGSAADSRGDARWWFAGGTGVASIVWFSLLGFGGSFLRPLFARPGAWRVLDSVVASIMLALGITLALSAA